MENEILTECPNCNAIWGMEEIDEQYCGCCGYPDPDEDDLDDDYIDSDDLTDSDVEYYNEYPAK